MAGQISFLRLLYHEGVVARNEADDDHQALNGRKWRLMYKLGFLTPKLTSRIPAGESDPKILNAAAGMEGITGAQYEVTPIGLRLASAETVAAQQDCFLRAILAYQAPSVIEKSHREWQPFSPLKIVLRTLLALEAAGEKVRIGFEEMASLVQFCKSEADVGRLVQQVMDYRRKRGSAPNKKTFDDAFRDEMWIANGKPVKQGSLRDYADTNFRYLKATGLLNGQSTSISLADEKRGLIGKILAADPVLLDDAAYLRRLWMGATLPTDDAIQGKAAIRALERELRDLGVLVESPAVAGLSPAELDQVRLLLVERRRVAREKIFGAEQRVKVEEINDLLALMCDLKKTRATYRSEAPMYLEWTFWRAFLAINSLVNEPWDIRQFEVSEDLLPLYFAPSRRPDMICEFDDWVLVVEVTFTENSRQEAVEGEPVRRHVADVLGRHRLSTGKPVFGLFVAPRIDSNTADTFGRGSWRDRDDHEVRLDIVPVTIIQFYQLFSSGFARGAGLSPLDVRGFLERSIACRTDHGPRWKKLIDDQVTESIRQFR